MQSFPNGSFFGGAGSVNRRYLVQNCHCLGQAWRGDCERFVSLVILDRDETMLGQQQAAYDTHSSSFGWGACPAIGGPHEHRGLAEVQWVRIAQIQLF
jgi:hypothetical protein